MRTYEVKIQVGWIEVVGQIMHRCLMQGWLGRPLGMHGLSNPGIPQGRNDQMCYNLHSMD